MICVRCSNVIEGNSRNVFTSLVMLIGVYCIKQVMLLLAACYHVNIYHTHARILPCLIHECCFVSSESPGSSLFMSRPTQNQHQLNSDFCRI